MSENKLTIEEANKLDENIKEFMIIRDEYELCRELLRSDNDILTKAEIEIDKQLYWKNDLFGKFSASTKKRIVDAILDILIDVAATNGKILMTKYFDKV